VFGGILGGIAVTLGTIAIIGVIATIAAIGVIATVILGGVPVGVVVIRVGVPLDVITTIAPIGVIATVILGGVPVGVITLVVLAGSRHIGVIINLLIVVRIGVLVPRVIRL